MITPSFGLTATERVLPRLALDWTTGLAQPGVDVVRAGVATFVGSSGLVQSASTDTQRIDWSTGIAGLLVEESRANICIRSDAFNAWNTSGSISVTANSTVAPDGNQTADTLTRTAGQSDAVLLAQTFTGDGVKAISIWVQKGTSPSNAIALYDATAVAYRLFANITWSGNTPVLAFTNGSLLKSTEYANDWWRLEFATEAVTAANTNRVYIYPGRSGSVNGDNLIVWGAQVENGAFCTSYIPTTTTAVTRNADVATITDTNFSDWFNPTEGTFVVEYNNQTDRRSGDIFGVYSATSANQMGFRSAGQNGKIAFLSRANSVFVVDYPAIVVPAGLVKASFAYAIDNYAVSRNGSATLVDTSAAIPSELNYISIGYGLGNGAQQVPSNTHIAKVLYYPHRLTNSEVQSFSKG